ncbi:MAG: glycosyltransferase family 2 protein [Pseudomonadales bacterium]|nr:glycosyltransferase family 2 protein [Pseudomonadales bacterium]
MAYKLSFLIPVYNHHIALRKTLENLESFGIPCLLVNDGSTEECRLAMQQLSESYSWVDLISLDENQGKGGAIMAGIKALYERGFSHAFQIDADGQHDLKPINKFIDASKSQPRSLILGYAQYDDSVPKSRLYGRYITHFWVWVETLSFKVKDSMCGYRVYPVESTYDIISTHSIGKRMEFDIEIVVRLFWKGVLPISFPVDVRYPKDGLSHFDALDDNIRISKTHAKLFFLMLLKSPVLLCRKLSG